MRTYTLDKESMIALWRRACGYEPVRTDCTVERADGPDLNAMLHTEMRSWYVKMLLQAPLPVLPLTDITQQVDPVASSEGVAVATLPEGCVRVARVDMEGWEREALIVTDAHGRMARVQDNPFARAGAVRPAAIISGNVMTLYSLAMPGARVKSVMAVMMPDPDGPYPVTDAMLAAMEVNR